ncbi:MAG TPA: XRE family transcriptional regulator [Baekduia sp.]|uniref:helix-turn-helix domain-containing protein n=1 Tax=Baekduia sp. TaxID=2600305 RepID=UPI002D7863A2|nr:XRE family transcriptional regulator [Baekduia sp.]HET6507227.1 XRE family transcriptional regulator [Baekduia sp.]
MAKPEELARQRLRALRLGAERTLEDVAEAAGMAASTLSRLESGKRRLTVDHLGVLAAALGTSVDALLAPEQHDDPRVRPRVHEAHGMRIAAISRRAGPGVPRAYHLTLHADRGAPDQRSHEGHEWIYVLSGRVRLLLGDDDLVLEAGEAAEFSTWTPHWMGAVDGPAEVLALMGPQGERVHLRTSSS